MKSYSGYVYHPNYPKRYKNNVNCQWTIEAPAGKKVQLEFKHFKMEISSGCRNDYIQIFDGSDSTAPLIGRYCGNDMPDSVVSTANFLTIVMVTNGDISSRGFIALYRQITGGNNQGGGSNNSDNKSEF